MMVRDEDLGKIVQCPGCKQQLQTQAPPTQIPAPSKTNTPKTAPPAPPKSNPGSGPRPGTQPLSGTKPNPGKPSTPSSATVKSLPKKGAPSRNEDEEDSSETDDEDTETGKTSRKKRIWMGWNNAYRGLNLASVGMVVYLVGLLLGGLGWVGYFFTRQDALFFAALGLSILSGLAFLVLDLWGRASLAMVTKERVPTARLLFTFSLIGFILCYLLLALSAAIPAAGVGAILLLAVGYWNALFGYWLLAIGLLNRSLAGLFLTQAISTISVNVIGAIFVAVMMLGMGIGSTELQQLATGGENQKAVVLLVGLIVLVLANTGLYLWALNLCLQLKNILGEKIGK
jgi:hypothetical protein